MSYPQTLSPLDGRYATDVEHLKRFFGERALVKMRVLIEARYLIALSEWGIVRPLTTEEKDILLDIYGSTALTTSGGERIYQIEQKIRHDVKAVEYYLRERLANTSMADITEFVHFGLTSEDIDNLALGILFNAALRVEIIPQLKDLVVELAKLADKHKAFPMLGRTHGQPAVPTTLGKELVNFAMRIEGELTRLKTMAVRGKVTGAVGNLNAHTLAAPEIDWVNRLQDFVIALGLQPASYTTQIMPHNDLCEILDCLKRVNSILIGLDRDIWDYLSRGYLTLAKVEEEVGSSTMPHKANPIDHERAEANLKIANTLLELLSRELLVNRLQRDLTDKYYLRVVGEAIGFSVVSWNATVRGLGKLQADRGTMEQDLLEHWEVLTEGIQTILRREGIADAYDLVKTRVRGRRLSQREFNELLAALGFYDGLMGKIEGLSPLTYLGEAVNLTDMALEELRKEGYNIQVNGES